MKVGLILVTDDDEGAVIPTIERWSSFADWLCVADNASTDASYREVYRWHKERARLGLRRLDLLLGMQQKVDAADIVQEVLERLPGDVEWLYLARVGEIPEPAGARRRA